MRQLLSTLLCIVLYVFPCSAEEKLHAICLDAENMRQFLNVLKGDGTEADVRAINTVNEGKHSPVCFRGEAEVMHSEHVSDHWVNGKKYTIWRLFVRRTYVNRMVTYHGRAPLTIYVAIVSKEGRDV